MSRLTFQPIPWEQRVINLAAPLIRSFEGLRLTTYDDYDGLVVHAGGKARGTLTIGYGTTMIDGKPLTAGMTITEQEAAQYLLADMQPLLSLLAGQTITIVAAAAYVSFGYNVGRGALMDVLNKKGVITHYTHSAQGTVLEALVVRRALESALIDAAQA